MTLNRKVSYFAILLIFITTLAFSLYYFFVIKRSFIEEFTQDVIELNSLIQTYENRYEEFTKIKNLITNDDVRMELENYYTSYNEIDGTFKNSEFQQLLRMTLNSKTVLINSLNLKVNSEFPFVFNDSNEVNVSFYLKVGDLIE
ncbi:MAG: hypothetical protein H0Z24_00735 [Thermosipho sp. (in: Bacteria)]|nr:hypothetical protein [Thermosipho sp. (in: thermotogales)]